MNSLELEMKNKGVSRNMMSEETQISLPTLRKYLKDPTKFPVGKARRISRMLDVDEAYGFSVLFV